jgi:hypothetical protein
MCPSPLTNRQGWGFPHLFLLQYYQQANNDTKEGSTLNQVQQQQSYWHECHQ